MSKHDYRLSLSLLVEMDIQSSSKAQAIKWAKGYIKQHPDIILKRHPPLDIRVEDCQEV